MRTIAITSPSQGDGKSTVTLNTAIAMSELEPRVLLIDGDLRRPSLHTKLEVKNEAGLADVLIGERDIRDVIIPTRYPGLDVLPSGTSVPNPIKLLQSPRLNEAIERALQHYRYVFFDTAACSANYDAAVISSKVAGTVVVISSGTTQSRSAHNAMRKLEHIGVKNIVGFVLNRVEPDRSQFDGYYLHEVTDDDERATRLMIEA